jgi:phosphoserine phosphatase
MKQLVIFDLDRTIYNGSLGQDFILHLATKQLISPKIISELSVALLEFETEIVSYEETVSTVLNYLGKELVGIERLRLNNSCGHKQQQLRAE